MTALGRKRPSWLQRPHLSILLMRVVLLVVLGVGVLALILIVQSQSQPRAPSICGCYTLAAGAQASRRSARCRIESADGFPATSATVGSVAPPPPVERHPSASATATQPVVAQPRGSLTLSAEPPCQVFVDDQLKGRTPVRALSLPVGGHRVEFISDLTGEHLSTSIDLHAGQTPLLHADFTAATPRLVLH